jgi:hypothetical protein
MGDWSRDDEAFFHAVVEYIEADRRSLALYISLALGTVVLTLTELMPGKDGLFSLETFSGFAKTAIVASLILLLASAWFYFGYQRKLLLLHKCVVAARLERDARFVHDRVLGDGPDADFTRNGWRFRLANFCLWVGASAYLLSLLFHLC